MPFGLKCSDPALEFPEEEVRSLTFLFDSIQTGATLRLSY